MRLSLLIFAVWVFADQVWALVQPRFQPKPVKITFRVGNPPGGRS